MFRPFLISKPYRNEPFAISALGSILALDGQASQITLADVSIVANPAYSGTSVQARAAEIRFAKLPDFVLEQLESDEDQILRRRQLLQAILL